MARKKLFAVIDVGSHEIQMKIAELGKNEPPRIVESIRRTLAIGTDTYTSGSISQPVLQACMDVLSSFSRDMKAYRIGECRILATSAFREADNQTYAVDQIGRQCGFDIEVLSNSEERYYHTLSTIDMIPDFPKLIEQGTLLVDISAGSIQLTVYNKGEFIFSQNLLLGSLRIRDLLSHLERRTSDLPGLMDEYVSIDLSTYHLHEPKDIIYKNLIITGHELSFLKKLADLEPESLVEWSEKNFNQIYQQLILHKPLDLALDRDIPAEHASLLLPAAIIMRRLISYTKAKNIYLPATTLCDGVLVDTARQVKGYSLSHDQTQDILSASRQLAKRFRTDRKHNESVETAVLSLFDETSRLHRLNKRQRLLLQTAAILRDCGKYVNISRHHDRSFNIIMASELIGLSTREQTIIAWIALFHGGTQKLQSAGFADLPSSDQLIVAKLTSLLRLADAIDTGHQQKVRDIQINIEDQEVILNLISERDLTLEIWMIEQKATLFYDVFGLKIRVKIRRPQK